MKSSFRSCRANGAFALLFLAAFAVLRGQQAPGVDAATLARYDRNHNGVLDPAEQAALDADTRAAAKGVVSTADATTPGKDDVIALSPFEVTSEANGYFQSNTISGTRLNSKIEDLGQSITVMTKEQM